MWKAPSSCGEHLMKTKIIGCSQEKIGLTNEGKPLAGHISLVIVLL